MRRGGERRWRAGAARRPAAACRGSDRTIRPASVRARDRRPGAPSPPLAGTSRRRARNVVDRRGRGRVVGPSRGRPRVVRGRRPNGALATSDSTVDAAFARVGSAVRVVGAGLRRAAARRRRDLRAVRSSGRRRIRAVRSSGSAVRAVQGVVERLLVHARLVERVAAAPVRQRQPRRRPHVLLRHDVGSPPGRVRRRRPGDDEVRAHAVDVERRADRGDPAQLGVGQHHRRQPGPRVGDPARPSPLGLGATRGERRPGPTRTPSAGARPRRGSSTSRDARTSTVSPNRSSSCGRSSPSSGFIVPTSRNARRATPTPRPARRARGPWRRRRAAGRRGGRAAG